MFTVVIKATMCILRATLHGKYCVISEYRPEINASDDIIVLLMTASIDVVVSHGAAMMTADFSDGRSVHFVARRTRIVAICN